VLDGLGDKGHATWAYHEAPDKSENVGTIEKILTATQGVLYVTLI
jgi:hypothetical protein